ncbi:hypothetical protein [Stutzerimonas nitrititolerans]|uniref:hypothetical protein n=1 Tax=Stutzerimonas nitrititolerans TaxID=2482751 RepID=UPI0028AF6BE7|nr:hypothetical protein [Stutzerimonas nitrititolerans]
MAYVPDNVLWHERGNLLSASKNADQSELLAMKFGVAPLDHGVQDDIVADEHHADLSEHGYVWQDEEIALDQAIGPVISEVDRRLSILGDFYPFQRVGASLHYRESKTLVYEFCLITSLQKQLSAKPFNRLPVLFELIATEAARFYLGDDAKGFRTGWPSHDHKERPTGLKDMLEKLSSLCGEFRWHPRFYIEDEPNEPKDEGMDFVVWKPIDPRLGQLFLLGQCACGDDWDSKLSDLDIKRLERWVNPVTYVDFVKAFAVPHHIPGHLIFADVSTRAGLTFDRVRLAIIAESNHKDFLKKFNKEEMDEVISLVSNRYKN